jgi:hypothetical protein
MHKKFFDPPASAFRQASSSQFIGRGVTLVMAAARGFVVANVYSNRPSRQESYPMRPQASTGRRRHLLDRPACGRSGRDFSKSKPSILLAM